MASPLRTTFANIFLGHIEEQLFNKSTVDKPKLYLRCLDDNFALFGDDQIRGRFSNILNFQHQILKFAIEKVTQYLSILDVEIKIVRSDVESLVWRKPSYT